ncbi:MAG: MFS transporter [Candidatus Dormibacteraeota bacterium]|nr:MFS transporter [Candidatus Dormibacteraeota bacterium]
MSQKWRTMLGVSLGAFCPPIGISTISIGLPVIAAAFHQPVTSAEWVIITYVLVITSLLMTFGRLGDLISTKRLYVVGFVVFTLGALASGLSPGFGWLLASRAVQGLGGAMMFSVAAAIVTRAFPASERGLALGINAVFIYAGLTVGPLLGAFVLLTSSWRGLFLINVPLGIGGIALALLFLRDEAERNRRAPARFDITGAFVGSLALFCLLLVLSQGPSWGLSSPSTIGLLLASLGLAACFIQWERRAAAPIVDLSLFSDRLFSAALVSSVLAYLAIFMLNLLVPFYLIHGLGFDYFHAGILLTPVPVAMVVFAPISGWLSDKVGSRALTSGGMILVAASFYWLSRLGLHPDYAQLVPPLLLNGIGTGLFTSPNNSAVMGAVSLERIGTAAGLLATSRNLGMALGTAMAAAVVALRLPAHLAQDAGPTVATLASYQDAFLVAGLVALLAALASVVRGSSASARTEPAAVERQAIG